MKVLVADDEAPAVARLTRLLTAHTDVTVVGMAADGEEAVERITTLAPDVVLLDIRMPKLDGFGVCAALGPEMPLVIFCTAYDDHALAAFEARAVDYLLKPVNPARLTEALARANALLQGTGARRKRGLHEIAAIVEERTPLLSRLLVHDERRALLIPVEQIDHIRAERNHCVIRVGTQRFRLRRTLASLAAKLDPALFLRTGKSDIVRLAAVREIQPWSHGDYRVVLHDGTTVSWSRRYRAGHPGM